MKNKFMIPNLFMEEQLDWIKKINKKSENKIYQIFGSLASDKIGSARESYRLPDLEEEKFVNLIKKAKKIDVEFAYTINLSCVGSATDFHKKNYKDYIKNLEDLGITQVIIANPLVAKYTTKYSDINICVSTVAGIDSLIKLEFWKKNFNCNKVCPDFSHNRNFQLLYELNRILPVELMVNEPCLLFCARRRFHYQIQAHTRKKDLDLIDNWPLSECSVEKENPLELIKNPFIRPEDLKVYNQINIDTFKIVGRTFNLDFVKTATKAYMDEKYDGDLLRIIPLLKNVFSGINVGKNKYVVDNKKLDGFIDFFSKGNFPCQVVSCDICKYCEKWSQKAVREND